MASRNHASGKEARIFSLVLIPLLGQYVVTLEEVGGQRLIPIWIGLSEGNAISLRLQGEQLPRPMTHDLMATALKALGATVDRIVIVDLKDGTYYATIELTADGASHRLDARPSDAMALAVRLNAPIFIDEKVWKKCPVIMKPITDTEVEKFKRELQSMTPEDFFKGLQQGGEGEKTS
ncbi:MAG: bifunctional nuclease family protein [Candidatus Omnitrophica bacterium]|nr:bifunctional nuclease family protein [Candidatus Omnitrophota bacterium]